MKKSHWLIALLAIVSLTCSKEDPQPVRPFYLGFTPFPYDISLEAVNYSYQRITADGDMITHHFDNGVPWVEALVKETYSDNILNDWAFRKTNTPAGHKVCVAVAPLSMLRNGMALYRGESNDLPLPTPWDTYTFADDEVKTAYLNYCISLIDYFEPDYFNMGVEANLLYAQAPEKWTDFVGFHSYIYSNLKALYPELTIFSSVTGAQLLPGFISSVDYSQQRLAALQIIESSDLYGVSFYPYMSDFQGNGYPDNTFDELFSLSKKPLAVAETGYIAQPFIINVNGTDVTISSDEMKQQKYISDLLAACVKHKALFVTLFVVRDYDQLWEDMGSGTDLSVAWRDTGLYDENGDARPALSVWKEYLSRTWQ
jgi:hypothetical protein